MLLKLVGETVLFITCVYFFNGSNAIPVDQRVILKDLNNETVDATLPDLPVEKIGKKYYHIEAILKGNYHEAMQYCNRHRMLVLSIETKEENDLLWEKLKELGDGEYCFWTSGTKLTDSHWVWLSTGKPIKFANWNPKQPDNNGRNEDCIEAIYYKNNALMWNDLTCNAQKHIICETEDVGFISKSMIVNVSAV